MDISEENSCWSDFKKAYLGSIICTLLLLVKHLVTISIQGMKRYKGGSRPPEDSKGDAQYNFTTKVKDRTAIDEDLRWQSIVKNDMENNILALIIVWLGLIPSVQSSYILHIVMLAVFTLARILFTIAYGLALQPWRSILWLIAIIAMFTMAINALNGAIFML
jgi:hypothetical protein